MVGKKKKKIEEGGRGVTQHGILIRGLFYVRQTCRAPLKISNNVFPTGNSSGMRIDFFLGCWKISYGRSTILPGVG